MDGNGPEGLPINPDALRWVGALLGALSEHTAAARVYGRLCTLGADGGGPVAATLAEIARAVELSEWTTGQALRWLADRGFVRVVRTGRASVFWLSFPADFPAFPFRDAAASLSAARSENTCSVILPNSEHGPGSGSEFGSARPLPRLSGGFSPIGGFFTGPSVDFSTIPRGFESLNPSRVLNPPPSPENPARERGSGQTQMVEAVGGVEADWNRAAWGPVARALLLAGLSDRRTIARTAARIADWLTPEDVQRIAARVKARGGGGGLIAREVEAEAERRAARAAAPKPNPARPAAARAALPDPERSNAELQAERGAVQALTDADVARLWALAYSAADPMVRRLMDDADAAGKDRREVMARARVRVLVAQFLPGMGKADALRPDAVQAEIER